MVCEYTFHGKHHRHPDQHVSRGGSPDCEVNLFFENMHIDIICIISSATSILISAFCDNYFKSF